VTEGEDKPLKYPVMFRKADLVLITKCDLLPYLPDVKVETIADALARVMPRPRYLSVSARTGDGMNRWLDWLEEVSALPRGAEITAPSNEGTPVA
jgi:hydrogenase nickel incorporation protein HypB